MLDAMTSFPPSYDQKIWIMIIGETCQIPQVWSSNFEPSLNLETLQLESCDIPEDEFSVSSDSGNSSCRRLVSREVSHLKIVSSILSPLWKAEQRDPPLKLGSGGWCWAWWTCHWCQVHPVFGTFSSHCWLLHGYLQRVHRLGRKKPEAAVPFPSSSFTPAPMLPCATTLTMQSHMQATKMNNNWTCARGIGFHLAVNIEGNGHTVVT